MYFVGSLEYLFESRLVLVNALTFNDEKLKVTTLRHRYSKWQNNYIEVIFMIQSSVIIFNLRIAGVSRGENLPKICDLTGKPQNLEGFYLLSCQPS